VCVKAPWHAFQMRNIVGVGPRAYPDSTAAIVCRASSGRASVPARLFESCEDARPTSRRKTRVIMLDPPHHRSHNGFETSLLRRGMLCGNHIYIGMHQMRDTKTDSKSIALAKTLLLQLRGDIDLHRLIGLNIKGLRRSNISSALLRHIQKLAHGSIALCICKMFEDSKRNELDSIPAIIESLPSLRLSPEQIHKIEEFGLRYGNSSDLSDVKSYLRGTFGLFIGMHSITFERLKKYRDKIGAHSESNIQINSLPSHAEFEIIYSFARQFYEVVSRNIIDVGPAPIRGYVGKGFFKLMESMGLEDPLFDFQDEA